MTDTTNKGRVVGLARANRPEAPAELTPEQAAEWRKLMAGQPADRFASTAWPLLIQYVRHVVAARHVAELSHKASAADLTDDAAFDEYELLRKMACRETRALTRLARALRLNRRAAP